MPMGHLIENELGQFAMEIEAIDMCVSTGHMNTQIKSHADK